MSSIAALRARAQARITATHHTQTLTMQRDGFTLTSRCHIGPRSGGTRREDGADVERGEYRLTLPAGSALVLRPGELVTIDGRAYRIVWAPANSNLNLADAYGCSEVR